MKVRKIKMSKLVENNWNPNHMDTHVLDALRKNITEHGFVQPLVVRPKGKKFEVLDGAHRMRALSDLGVKEVPCVIVDDSDEEARLRTLTMNRLRGRLDYSEVADMLGDLILDDEAIRASLAWSDNQLEEIRSLVTEAPSLSLELPEEERHMLLDFYVTPEDARTIEQALAATGEKNRGIALTKIAERYMKDEGTRD